jgi:hypothetical protein
MADWYYAHDEEQFGPVTAAALREMAQQGRLQRDDLIWREGMQRWAPAHKVRGLFPSESDLPGPGTNGQSAAPQGAALLEPPPVPDPVLSTAASPKSVEPPPQASPTDSPSQLSSDDDLPEPGSDYGPDEDDARSGKSDETAIDALPLGGPEESKLHMPALGAPETPSGRQESDVVVVFEPSQTTPKPTTLARKGAESDDRRAQPTAAATAKHTRIDVPAGPSRFGENTALFLQTFTWVSCLLVILAGGGVYVTALVMTHDAPKRLAASGMYAAFVLAAYVLAHTTERICRVLGQWFGGNSQAKSRRLLRERNAKRFQ